MSLLDPSSFKQENDGFYTSHGYMSTPSSIGNKPMLDIQDIQKKSGSTGFSVKPEDLIYVSDWKASGANPNLGKRNPSKLIDWNLFGIDRSLFGLEEEESLAVDTSAQDRIARAEGDILREGGDGSSDMGGPTGSTGKGDMTGIDGNFGVEQGRGSYDMGQVHDAGIAEAGKQGVAGAISGAPMGLAGIGVSGIAGALGGYVQGAGFNLGKQTVENIQAQRAASRYSGLLEASGFDDANIDTNPHGSHTNTNNYDIDSGYGGMDYGGPTDTSPHGAHTEEASVEADMGMGSYGGGGETGADGNDGSGGSDAGAGEGHGGGSSSDNDGGHGGGTGGMGGASEEGW